MNSVWVSRGTAPRIHTLVITLWCQSASRIIRLTMGELPGGYR